MTKALEAACVAYRPSFKKSDAETQRVVKKVVADIIRAYAANVTEEMAAECYGRVEIEKDADGKFLRGKRCGSAEQVRAAIERGLV